MADKNEEGNPQNSDNKSSQGANNSELVPQGAGDGTGEVRENEGGNVQPQQQQAPQPTTFESFLAITKSLILRAIVIYFITSFFRKNSTPSYSGSNSVTKLPAINIFDNGTLLDMYMFISENTVFNEFDDENYLFWKKTGLIYGDWYGGPNGDGTFSQSTTITPSEKVKNNGSIYLHVYIVRHGYSPNPSSEKKYSNNQMVYGYKQLNRYKRQRYTKTHNLLTGETALTAEQQRIAKKQRGEIISHWHPNLTVNLVVDHTKWSKGMVPVPLDEYIVFLPDEIHYKPILYMNDYWNMMRDYQPINSTTTSLNLLVTFQPLSLFRWQLYSSQGMRSQWNNLDVFGDLFSHEEDEEDYDPLKEALLDTSPYLLGLTVFVSILHSVFEFLAFKNDIQFWNNRKSLEGLSVRSVFFNVFQSVIILLYVMDNDTNTIVRISCFVALAVELWKINKAVDISINRESKIFGIIPKISFNDKGSYIESSTREYDILAFKYLSRAIYPLLVCYGIYSLIYQEHKGWYSWVLSMLYGFLLTFGFIMMTPQLFINYKLKSVAHLPWRMMTYKALNTFIDDMFAFVIKMPTMYRLGCFRDAGSGGSEEVAISIFYCLKHLGVLLYMESLLLAFCEAKTSPELLTEDDIYIVFFIFLYQKFIYKTDHSRVNEFGFSGEMEEEVNNKKGAIENKENGDVSQPEKSAKEKKKD